MLTFILLFLLIYFIVWPMLRVMLAVRRTRNQMREAFNRASGQPQGRRPDPATHPAPRRKKIDNDVGEYVKFEEIQGATRTIETSGSTTTISEQQIVDAEWEEI